LALCFALVLLTAGCGGGGSGDVAGGNTGGSGGNNNPPPPPPNNNGPVQVEGPSAQIAWSPASGPVAGYRVLVSRNGGTYAVEIDTPQPRTDVKGEPGDLVTVRVAAFDAFGNFGPASPVSEPMKFVAAPSPPPSGEPTDPGPDPSGGDDDDGEVAGGGNGGSGGGGTQPGETPDEPNLSPTRPGDVDGDGAVDLVWQSADGALLRITSADLSHARTWSLPSGSWRAAAVGDFDGDLLEDVLFAGNGSLAIARGAWMRSAGGDLALETWSALPDGTQAGASGDFDGDGASDVMIAGPDDAYLALSNGSTAALPALQPGHAVVGGGDADGDGHADLFVQGPSGASLLKVVGASVVSIQALPAPDGAAVEGVADFDSNGTHDLAFRTAPDALTLEHAQQPFSSWVETAPAGSALVGCRDYDADGSNDRLWRNAEGLTVVTSGGTQAVPVDPASTWRLLRDCR
jgi:hypothetical protein